MNNWGLNQDFNLKRLERYITLSWQSGALPVVLLTKADLSPNHQHDLEAAEKIAQGSKVYAISAKTGQGLENLEEMLQPGKTIVLLGSSGVGKSSLVNALAGEEMMAVNEIRQEDSKGRHTTTHRQLVLLKNGVMLIDTPGMRELGMWDTRVGLGEAFVDVEQFLGQCKFSNCKHQSEPGCAIKAALQSGQLSKKRWDSYLALQQESHYATDKEDYTQRKQQWAKHISKWNRQKKKAGY